MKISKYLTALAAACSLLCLVTPASATVVNVSLSGKSNLWSDGGFAPVSVAVVAGQSVIVAASAQINIGLPAGNVNADGSTANASVTHSALNGVNAITGFAGSLLGLWSGTATPFYIGLGGTFTAPGASSTLSLGVLDGNGGFTDNTGSFAVTVTTPTPAGVPDFGSTLSLMAIGLGLMFAYRKHVLA